MKKPALTFTRRNVAFLGICLGGLILLLLISILPLIAQQKDLEKKIPEMKAALADQAQLAIILQTIDKKLQTLEELDTLPSVAEESLPIIELSSIMEQVSNLALEENIKLVRIDSVMPENSENLKRLTFKSDLQGPLANLRSFIFALLQVPYIEKIENMHIQSNSDTLDLNLVFSVRLT